MSTSDRRATGGFADERAFSGSGGASESLTKMSFSLELLKSSYDNECINNTIYLIHLHHADLCICKLVMIFCLEESVPWAVP